MANSTFIQGLREIIELKNAGELTEKDFTNAKAILLGEAEKEAANPYDETANAENRPLASGKKFRKRSAADWVARMNKDLKVESTTTDADPRKTRMLGLWMEMTAAFAPNGKSDGITAETINDALKTSYTEDGYIMYADFTKGGNLLAGKWDVKSGQAAKVLDLFTNCGEYHFDFAKAVYGAFDNSLFIDLGFYKIVGKTSKKPYQTSNKIRMTYNDDVTKIAYMECYWEDDPNDQEEESILNLFKDENFAAEIEKRGIKADAPPKKISTY